MARRALLAQVQVADIGVFDLAGVVGKRIFVVWNAITVAAVPRTFRLHRVVEYVTVGPCTQLFTVDSLDAHGDTR
jgi:hypothetical protein